MNITNGQDKDIRKFMPDYNKEKSSVIAEAGNDNGDTFKGSFLVKIYRKGVFRFTDSKMTKKIK